MKHILVNLTLREGETEFPAYKQPMEFEGDPKEDEIYDATIKQLFGEPDEIDKDGYWYRGGEYVVYGCTYQYIDEDDFHVLNNFI